MQQFEMSTKPSYEDLMPRSERQETRESHILLVHIPHGFAREHIGAKVEFDYGRVRIFGERPLQNNTIKRFNVVHQVPPTCDINRIRGKLEGGIVTITMPKKVISMEEPDQKLPPTEEAPKAPVEETEASPDKDQAPKTPEQESEPSPDKDQAPKTPEQESVPEQESEPSPKTPEQESEPSPDKEHAPKTPEQESEPSPDNDQTPKTPVQETQPSPDKDQAPKTPAQGTEPSKDNDQTPKTPVQETQPSPDKEPEGIPPQSTTEEDQQAIAAKVEDKTCQEGISDQDPKSTIQNKHKGDSNSVPKITGKDQGKVIPESPAKRIKDMAASASQAVTRLAKSFDEEDKQKLIYVGAAVAVVALGFYASYKFRTSLRK